MNKIWQFMKRMRHTLAPEGTRLDLCIKVFFEFYQFKLPVLLHNLTLQVRWRWRSLLWWRDSRSAPARARFETIEPVAERPTVPAHTASVDIIVCVHNALDDVRHCLASVVEHTPPPYRLILVDDGSDAPTRDYLAAFAEEHGATLLRSDTGTGYTFAANRGMRAAEGDFALLLNSDTLVTSRWLDRLVACAASDPRIGMVGPLSNTASWQSIPELAEGDDWAENRLPEGMTVAEMGDWVARTSGRLYPRRALLNGFCLLLRREMLAEVGLFDEATFGAGYGEEDDLALRARAAGWALALADDAYVYHAQSRSYSNARRKELSERAGERLRAKHDTGILKASVAASADGRVMAGIRARARVLFERRDFIQRGRARFVGRSVLFVLPVAAPGGGANIVISEAQAMQAMGVEVAIFNLEPYRLGFERAYAQANVPVIYAELDDLTHIATRYDAVVATHNSSVAWLEPIPTEQGRPVRAYYVQGFEPYMYEPDTEAYRVALASYTQFSDLVRFTKTEWTRREVFEATGANLAVVGPSFELDLFRPRPLDGEVGGTIEPGLDRPLRVAAMVRPESPYRAPAMTMRLLRRMIQRYPRRVEAWLFGTTLSSPSFQLLPHDFGWRMAGILSPWQVANFLNVTDIFVDFSEHQAMGLTAMEAMGCGNAVIVPEYGGATSFTRHEHNGLVVDTTSEEACWEALDRLITHHALRQQLRRQALDDICTFHPERSAYNILHALFESARDG